MLHVVQRDSQASRSSSGTAKLQCLGQSCCLCILDMTVAFSLCSRMASSGFFHDTAHNQHLHPWGYELGTFSGYMLTKFEFIHSINVFLLCVGNFLIYLEVECRKHSVLLCFTGLSFSTQHFAARIQEEEMTY